MINSQKAKEFLDKPSGDWLWVSQHKQKAIEAVEIAEQEMTDKAVEAFKNSCYDSCYYVYHNCDGCELLNGFINKLNS